MKNIYFILSLLFSLQIHAQNNRYVVRFADKKGTPFSINEPAQFLSPKAIERRSRYNIPIDDTDLPVAPQYIDSVLKTGKVVILNQSKWLNQILVETDDPEALSTIRSFSFVKETRLVNRMGAPNPVSRKQFTINLKEIQFIADESQNTNILDYGGGFGQIHLHEGEFLHNKGLRGEGMLIAVIDAGFYHYQKLHAFDSINKNKQVLDTYDFVKNKKSVQEEHAHGMYCFSLLAANLPGKLIGSSPKADYLLYRSEDADSESQAEEQNWIAAMERADSIGADISTTSLGYSNQFDNPLHNYTYNQLNGKFSMMALAATIAARKGMLVLVSAGNEGAKEWKYITTPADADSILSVGAVDISGNPAGFTSYGPTADGRIAPVAASAGVATLVASTTGGIISGNGTSFSSPILAGLAACLWQAFPEFTNMQILQVIKESSSQYKSPDNRVGYGIPNFRLAYQELEKQRNERQMMAVLGERVMKVYPNPFKDKFTITIHPKNTALATFLLYSQNGKLITTQQVSLIANKPAEVIFSQLQHLPKGSYVLQFIDGKMNESLQLFLQ